MKLASLKNGRNGDLVVVSRDLSTAVRVPGIALTLQHAIDQWSDVNNALTDVYQQLNAGKLEYAFAFDAKQCASPIPRAYQWADGSAYVNHVELVRRARGAEMPESFWQEPLIYQGGSDDFLGPRDDIPLGDPDWGLDFEGEIAVVTGDVPMRTMATQALEYIKLLMLVNDVSLRRLIPAELSKGFGFYQSKPATSFSPVAITPDELGDAWQEGKVHLPLLSQLNGELFGKPNAGVDMTFSFADLIEHATKTRNLSCGSIIGSGTVSNKQGAEYGTSISEGGVGYSCIAEIRMIETIRTGKPVTSFLNYGDNVKIEMFGADGAKIFGTIEQNVVQGCRTL